MKNIDEVIYAEGLSTYKRMAIMQFFNDAAPYVKVYEDKVSTYLDYTDTVRVGDYQVMYDPELTFPMLNPETGDVIGMVSMPELFATVYSLYVFARTYQPLVVEPPEQP